MTESHATEEPAVREPLYGVEPGDDLRLTITVPAATITRVVRYTPEQWARCTQREREQLIGSLIARGMMSDLIIEARAEPGA